jgi:hypothetical protein
MYGLFACFLPMFALGLVDLRFVRDDWMNAADLLDLRKLPYARALGQLIDNSWFGAHERRVFFLSWVLEFHLIAPGGRTAWLSYGTLLSLHLGAALLIARAFHTLTGDRFFAAAAGLASLFAPTFTQGAFFLNNLFFVQPWFFLALTVYLLIHPRKKRALDWLCLAASALACQFSGEAAIFALYAVLGVSVIAFGISGRGLRERSPLRPLVAGLVSAAALLIYVKAVMSVSRPQPAAHFDAAACGDYLAAFWRVSCQFYGLRNERYGYGEIPPGGTVLAATAASLLAGALLLRKIGPAPPPRTWRALFAILAGAAAALVAAVAMLLFGAFIGTRPGLETRYLYVPGEMAALLAVTALFLLGGAFAATRRVLLPLLLAGLCWCMFLDYYNLVDIWGTQKRIDAGIWRKLDPLITARTRQIVTYNPFQSYLMAPWHSNAVSDFQADWGVSGRLWVLRGGARPVSIAKWARRRTDGGLDFTGYYGGETWKGREDETVFITYCYGPHFKDLVSAQPHVFAHYDDFARSAAEIAASLKP